MIARGGMKIQKSMACKRHMKRRQFLFQVFWDGEKSGLLVLPAAVGLQGTNRQNLNVKTVKYHLSFLVISFTSPESHGDTMKREKR